jgi:Family of unknown function (DUF5694)
MIKKILFLISLCLVLIIPEMISQSGNKVKVMILGTYHMANPGADAANIEADDVMKPKRQAELQDLAEKLAKFKPTKIAIESTYGAMSRVFMYRAVHQGLSLDSLGPNETFQIAFRLADMLGLETVYPIDHRMDINPPSIGALFSERPDRLEYFENTIGAVQDSLNYWTENVLLKGTISNFLAFMNSDRLIELNYALYLDLVKELWSESYLSGTEMLSLWYQRNLRIFQNLIKVTDFDNPEERILIVIGQGHAKPLRDFVQDAGYYEFVDVNEFIK